MAASKCRKKRKEHVKTLVEVIIEAQMTTLGASSVSILLGNLSNDDGDGNENVISKYNFSFL